MLKTLNCKPGSYIEIVPIGLLCTLQYNSNGILQKVILGFDHLNHRDEDILDSDFTVELKRIGIIPQRINFTLGTTWVRGVFYTKKLFKDNGIIPDCFKESILQDLKSNPRDYTFYAGDLKNDSFNIKGGIIISNRLSTLGFTVLPGYPVYDDVTPLPISQIMQIKQSPFIFPLLSGILVCENSATFRYVSLELSQYTVINTTNYLDSFGYIHTRIDLPHKSLDKSYSEVVQQDIQSKSIVVLDNDDILYSRHQSSLLRSRLSRNIYCSVCGKSMTIPIRGYAMCEDPHCVSKLYPIIQRFTTVLNLPSLTFEEFTHHIIEKEITCLTDILLLDKYAGSNIECTLSTLLSAIVPVSFIRNIDFFQQFTNYLGSVEAFDYYIQNPDAIITDLYLNKLSATGFCNWLKDPFNVLQLQTLLHCNQITIMPVSRKFEGAPIFRNKTICITGKFRHGTIEDVISILKSYSAKVITQFDNTVDCVIIGHFEDEDKNITELATSYHIPIYGEDDFFKSYEIDLDIRKQRDMLDNYLK